MNWQIFNSIGYLSIALWLAVLPLWLIYWRGQYAWLRYFATALTLAAFACAKFNSAAHVNRIQTIPSAKLTEQESRQEEIRQAALEARSEEVAQIRFAEDDAGDFLDKAGMDEADLKYLGDAGKPAVPEWKRQKQSRSQDAPQDASPEEILEAQVTGPQEATGVDVAMPNESTRAAPLMMSEADVALAHRMDRWNLTITRYLLFAAILLLAADYLRRANDYDRASLPLPLPSAWLNSLTPMPALVIRPQPPRRAIPDELVWLARRGDSFVYLTDNPEAATAAKTQLEFSPKWRRPQVLRVTDGRDDISDEFIFESLWFKRGSFIVDSAARAQSLLVSFTECLERRRATRAKVKQTAHIVWDVSSPLPATTRATLAKLADASGLSIFEFQQST